MRASGNSSTRAIRPTRMSTFRKSSKPIKERGGGGEAAVAGARASGLARGRRGRRCVASAGARLRGLLIARLRGLAGRSGRLGRILLAWRHRHRRAVLLHRLCGRGRRDHFHRRGRRRDRRGGGLNLARLGSGAGASARCTGALSLGACATGTAGAGDGATAACTGGATWRSLTFLTSTAPAVTITAAATPAAAFDASVDTPADTALLAVKPPAAVMATPAAPLLPAAAPPLAAARPRPLHPFRPSRATAS